MGGNALELRILSTRFAICRFGPDEALPSEALAAPLSSITRTAEELSLVCVEAAVPAGGRVERGWRCLAVVGPLDFGEIGILASLTRPLAEIGVSVFALSTFDTDYLLVKEHDLDVAVTALRAAGHEVGEQGTRNRESP